MDVNNLFIDALKRAITEQSDYTIGHFRTGADANMGFGSGYPIWYYGELFAVIQWNGGDLSVVDIEGHVEFPDATTFAFIAALEWAFQKSFDAGLEVM
jgi:hypothetical protein